MDAGELEVFEERAAIMEFDGKLPRSVAEYRARRAPPKPTPAAPSISPEKIGKNYAEFREFWRNRWR